MGPALAPEGPAVLVYDGDCSLCRASALWLLRRALAGGARDLMADAREVDGFKVLATKTDVADARTLREVGDKLRDRIGSGVVVLFGVGDDKVSVLAMVTPDLTKRFHAGKIVGEVAGLLGGRGGGRPDMAQAGGKDASRVDDAIKKVFDIVRV